MLKQVVLVVILSLAFSCNAQDTLTWVSNDIAIRSDDLPVDIIFQLGDPDSTLVEISVSVGASENSNLYSVSGGQITLSLSSAEENVSSAYFERQSSSSAASALRPGNLFNFFAVILSLFAVMHARDSKFLIAFILVFFCISYVNCQAEDRYSVVIKVPRDWKWNSVQLSNVNSVITTGSELFETNDLIIEQYGGNIQGLDHTVSLPNVIFQRNVDITANDIDIEGIINDNASVQLNGIENVQLVVTNTFSGDIQINSNDDIQIGGGDYCSVESQTVESIFLDCGNSAGLISMSSESDISLSLPSGIEVPPSSSNSPSPSVTSIASATPSRSESNSVAASTSSSQSRSATSAPSQSSTVPPSASPSETTAASASQTPSNSLSATSAPSTSASRTPSETRSPLVPTPTSTPTSSTSHSRTPTPSRTPSFTPSSSETPTSTATQTPTPSTSPPPCNCCRGSNSCAGSCGGNAGDCWCDTSCATIFNDCCFDACALCGQCC